jgi:signal transduction histidine kinase
MQQAGAFAAISGAYFLAGTLGLKLAFVHVSATAVWPPTGIAIAAVVLFGYRAALPVFVGAFLVNITTAGSVATVTGIALGNTLEALLGGWLVNRFASGRRAFERPRDVMAFTGLAAVVSPVAAASIGVTSLCVGGAAAWRDFGAIWVTWWLGDAVGAILFAPAAILWGSERPRLRLDPRRVAEAALVIAALVVSGGVAFLGWLPGANPNLPLQFLCLPPLVWAAFRFRPRFTALITLLLSGMALVGTLHGFGVFARESPNESLLLLQSYMGVLCVMGLCVGAAIAQRERAEEGLRASEERLRIAGKMEALGRLAGSVAHDFNNILTVIQGHADMMAMATPSGRPVDPSIGAITGATEHAARLTQRLLAFSRRQVLSPRTHDLNAIIGEMGTLVRRLIGERVAVSVDLGPGPHPVKVDRMQIEQVVMNLALNARDAMPDGGSLLLQTGLVDGVPDRRAGGRHVVLRVRDTGIGMDAETRRRLFEPFFTTKERGVGVGLGLASVYGIVQQSSGHILVASERGHGTTFEIFLPVSTDPIEHPTQPPSRPASVGPAVAGTRTILVAEDEPAVRTMFRAVLERQGYRVLVAANGAEALAICEQEGHIDLLLTDLVMPLLNGKELAAKVAIVRPTMKRVFMSGHPADVLGDDMTLGLEGVVLSKPIAPAALASILREVLEDER